MIDRARCWLAMPFAAVVMLPSVAAAQQSGAILSTSQTTNLVFNPAITTTTNLNTFTTQIIGQIVGGSIVYDQTFGLPYANATVQAGQTAAIAAITAAGAPGVVIGTPVLTASTTTTTTNSVTIYSLVSSIDTIGPGVVTFGPATVPVGLLTTCSGLNSLPSTTAPTCTDTG